MLEDLRANCFKTSSQTSHLCSSKAATLLLGNYKSERNGGIPIALLPLSSWHFGSGFSWGKEETKKHQPLCLHLHVVHR